ncbi:MAG: hypothetical protein LUQ47_00620 [Methanotrichaceae archaeon]|nr:hypothetical protein [Methanotrichaceae archaeon]
MFPEIIKILSAFHAISAAGLKQMNKGLYIDVAICGNDKEPKEVVTSLAQEIENLRPLDVGLLSTSCLV